MPITLQPNAAPDPVEVFGTRTGIERKVGVKNLKYYVALDGDPDAVSEPPEIATNIADDLEEAATDMHDAWRQYLQSIRLPGEAVSDVTLGSSNAVEARWLADTNEYGAAVKAWFGRTIDAPQGSDVPQQIGTAIDEWNRRLESLRTGKALLGYQTDEGVIDEDADEPGGFETVEVERTVACTDDEYSSN